MSHDHPLEEKQQVWQQRWFLRGNSGKQRNNSRTGQQGSQRTDTHIQREGMGSVHRWREGWRIRPVSEAAKAPARPLPAVLFFQARGGAFRVKEPAEVP